MGDTTLYDEDIYAWAEQQAAVLRRMALRRDLPNDLDLEHVTEEIADLGISELRAVESLVNNILVHLILIRTDHEASAVSHWTHEVITWQAALQRRFTPAMRRRIDMEDLWRRAVREACRHLEAEDRTIARVRIEIHRAESCPLSLDGLLSDAFSVTEAARQVGHPDRP